MDRDVIITIEVSQPHEPRVWIEEYNGSYAAMVTLFPHIEFRDVPVEVIFVVDRSGSMCGQRIADAKESLLLLLRALPVDCFFNIIGFGSSCDALFPISVKYDELYLSLATDHVRSLKADLGGTDLILPLIQVYGSPVLKGYSRQVFEYLII